MTVAPGMNKCCGSTAGQRQAYLEGDQYCLPDDNGLQVLSASVSHAHTLAHDWGYRLVAKEPGTSAISDTTKTMVYCLTNASTTYSFAPSFGYGLPTGVAASSLDLGVTILNGSHVFGSGSLNLN